jgi:hypothetical protein
MRDQSLVAVLRNKRYSYGDEINMLNRYFLWATITKKIINSKKALRKAEAKTK